MQWGSTAAVSPHVYLAARWGRALDNPCTHSVASRTLTPGLPPHQWSARAPGPAGEASVQGDSGPARTGVILGGRRAQRSRGRPQSKGEDRGAVARHLHPQWDCVPGPGFCVVHAKLGRSAASLPGEDTGDQGGRRRHIPRVRGPLGGLPGSGTAILTAVINDSDGRGHLALKTVHGVKSRGS